MNSGPLVSIGVPVYNDAPWLRNALDHIVNQEYRNLEIIITDNGSTDGSRKICREYAQKDSRIRYYENKYNLGARGSHRLVFEVSSGEFFAWGHGHDFYEPQFVSKMLEVMNTYPSVVMCCSKTATYRKDGTIFVPPSLLDTRNMPPAERIIKLIQFRMSGGSMDIFFGLYRSDILSQVNFTRDSVSFDEIFLAEMCLLGEFLQINDVLLEKLDHSEHRGNPRRSQDAYRKHIDTLPLSKGTIIKEYTPRLYSYISYMNMVEFSGLGNEDIAKVYQKIIEEAQCHRKQITDEVEYLIEQFNKRVIKQEVDSMVRNIWIVEVLYVIERVKILGLYKDDYISIEKYCISSIQNFQKQENIFRKLFSI